MGCEVGVGPVDEGGSVGPIEDLDGGGVGPIDCVGGSAGPMEDLDGGSVGPMDSFIFSSEAAESNAFYNMRV
eukprot:m.87537 g.87537  ORF g.87537 m.87537 type:complete len:72 (-) comp13115_c0_seq1:39-254(-)